MVAVSNQDIQILHRIYERCESNVIYSIMRFYITGSDSNNQAQIHCQIWLRHIAYGTFLEDQQSLCPFISSLIVLKLCTDTGNDTTPLIAG